ncbi:hypothetical protein ACLOJK_001763 [Asimina triloba]
MGGCASVHKTPDSAMKFHISIGSKDKKMVIPSPADEKPVNGEKPIDGFGSPRKKLGQLCLDPLSPQLSSRDFGPTIPSSEKGITFHDKCLFVRRHSFSCKGEMFYESRAWLDSDCEDDFFSVNGDFTPSRGSTPIHQRSTPATPGLKKAPFMERAPNYKLEPSPTSLKKKLGELFQESIEGEQIPEAQTHGSNEKVANGKIEAVSAQLQIPSKSPAGTPYMTGPNSVCSSQRTPNGEFKPEKEHKGRLDHCCLPNLLSTLSFHERKRQQLSPVVHN